MSARMLRKPLSKVEAVKAEAQRRILARYSEFDQRNLIMEGGADYAAMKTWIRSMRRASNDIEALLLTDPVLEIGRADLWPEG